MSHRFEGTQSLSLQYDAAYTPRSSTCNANPRDVQTYLLLMPLFIVSLLLLYLRVEAGYDRPLKHRAMVQLRQEVRLKSFGARFVVVVHKLLAIAFDVASRPS
jgi:hypothetical protein